MQNTQLASAAAISTKDIVTWSITALAISISLLWNLYNLIETKRIAKQIRLDTFDFDEWKDKRATLVSRLDDFESCADRLLALTLGEHKAAHLIKEIAKEGRELVSAHEALLRSLDRVGGDYWLHLGFGKSVDGESDWDRLNSSLANISIIGDDSAKIKSELQKIKPFVRSISSGVTERVSNQTATHRPE